MPQEAAVWRHLAEGGDKHPLSLKLPLLSVGEQESCLRMRHCWFPLLWSELRSHPPLLSYPAARFSCPVVTGSVLAVASWELTQRSVMKGSWKKETLLDPRPDQFPD